MYDCNPLCSIGFDRTRIAWEWYCVKGAQSYQGKQQSRGVVASGRGVPQQRIECAKLVRAKRRIAVSTFHYRQQKVWNALQERNQFVEVPLQVNEYRNENIAATVHIGEIRADIHNGADEATLTALVHALKSC